MTDYPHPIPAGRIAVDALVTWPHYHAHGCTFLCGRVERFYAGSNRYGVVTPKGERTPPARKLELWNPKAPRVADAMECYHRAGPPHTIHPKSEG